MRKNKNQYKCREGVHASWLFSLFKLVKDRQKEMFCTKILLSSSAVYAI